MAMLLRVPDHRLTALFVGDGHVPFERATISYIARHFLLGPSPSGSQLRRAPTPLPRRDVPMPRTTPPDPRERLTLGIAFTRLVLSPFKTLLLRPSTVFPQRHQSLGCHENSLSFLKSGTSPLDKVLIMLIFCISDALIFGALLTL